MKLTQCSIVIFTSVALLAACGGRKPNPVAEFEVGDASLSCNGIKAEMAYIDMQVSKLIPDSKKTGKNVALGVTGYFLLVPLFFMDFSKAERIEIEAYQARYLSLQQIADKKGCGSLTETEVTVAIASSEDVDSSDSIPPKMTKEEMGNLETPSATEVTLSTNQIDVAAEKLEKLKKLNQQGLITDEEYSERRREILDKLIEE